MTDFFISYTSPDRPWSAWLAWHLEAAGWTTILGALWTLLQTLGEAEEADTVARTSLEWLLAADASMLTAEVRRIREQLEQWRGRLETQRER